MEPQFKIGEICDYRYAPDPDTQEIRRGPVTAILIQAHGSVLYAFNESKDGSFGNAPTHSDRPEWTSGVWAVDGDLMAMAFGYQCAETEAPGVLAH